MEAPDSGRLQVKQSSKGYQKDKEEGDSIEHMIKKSPTVAKEEKVEDGPVRETVTSSQKSTGEMYRKKAGLMQLSKEELLHLLSIMEGEVQVNVLQLYYVYTVTHSLIFVWSGTKLYAEEENDLASRSSSEVSFNQFL